MIEKPLIFAGPSLTLEDRQKNPGFSYAPPAARGDILRLLSNDRQPSPRQIGLIDGYFDDRPSVLHKELLEAMSAGIAVYGAASMGALRAAELSVFGMTGVGDIFSQYQQGQLESDADVAVLHGPEHLGYPVLSLPQVDVIATLASMDQEHQMSFEQAEHIKQISAKIFYKNRSWQAVAEGAETHETAQCRLCKILEGSHVQAKRNDALSLLQRINEDSHKSPDSELDKRNAPPFTPAYQNIKSGLSSRQDRPEKDLRH